MLLPISHVSTRVAGHGSRRTRGAGTEAGSNNPIKSELLLAWQKLKPGLATVTAVALGLLVPLKVIRVAHGNIAVALAVAQYADKSTVITGLLVLAAWPALMLAMAFTAFGMAHACADIRRATLSRGPITSGLVALRRLCLLSVPFSLELWLSGALLPWPYVIAAIVLIALFSWRIYRSQTRSSASKEAPQWLRRASAMRIALVASFLATGLALLVLDQLLTPILDDRVWLPAHRIQMASGTTVVGYELSEDNGRVTMLVDGTRSIAFVDRATVVTDQLCETKDAADGRSFWDLSRHRVRAHLPTCDE